MMTVSVEEVIIVIHEAARFSLPAPYSTSPQTVREAGIGIPIVWRHAGNAGLLRGRDLDEQSEQDHNKPHPPVLSSAGCGVDTIEGDRERATWTDIGDGARRILTECMNRIASLYGAIMVW